MPMNLLFILIIPFPFKSKPIVAYTVITGNRLTGQHIILIKGGAITTENLIALMLLSVKNKRVSSCIPYGTHPSICFSLSLEKVIMHPIFINASASLLMNMILLTTVA